MCSTSLYKPVQLNLSHLRNSTYSFPGFTSTMYRDDTKMCRGFHLCPQAAVERRGLDGVPEKAGGDGSSMRGTQRQCPPERPGLRTQLQNSDGWILQLVLTRFNGSRMRRSAEEGGVAEKTLASS